MQNFQQKLHVIGAYFTIHPFSALTLLVGWQEGNRALKISHQQSSKGSSLGGYSRSSEVTHGLMKYTC